MRPAALAQPGRVDLKASLLEEMKCEPVARGLQLRRAPVHDQPRLDAALGHFLEARRFPAPPRPYLWLRGLEAALYRADGTPDRAVTDDRQAMQLGRHRGNEGITIGREQGRGGVGDC